MNYMDKVESLMDGFKDGAISYADMMKALLDITVIEYNDTVKEENQVCVKPKCDINLDFTTKYFSEEDLRLLEELTDDLVI